MQGGVFLVCVKRGVQNPLESSHQVNLWLECEKKVGKRYKRHSFSCLGFLFLLSRASPSLLTLLSFGDFAVFRPGSGLKSSKLPKDSRVKGRLDHAKTKSLMGLQFQWAPSVGNGTQNWTGTLSTTSPRQSSEVTFCGERRTVCPRLLHSMHVSYN